MDAILRGVKGARVFFELLQKILVTGDDTMIATTFWYYSDKLYVNFKDQGIAEGISGWRIHSLRF